MTAGVSSSSFVGRADELARLRAALEAAARRAPNAVLVGGEAGIGKTRLVAEASARARAAGAHVLCGGCIELGGGGLPYGPIAEALRGLVEDRGPSVLADLIGPASSQLERLLPIGGVYDQWEDETLASGSARARLFELLLRLLGQLGAAEPVLLVVEDLHWADRSTLDLLTFLVRNVREERLLVVATYRTDEVRERHALRVVLAELERSRKVESIELARFERDELGALLDGILGAPPPADVLESVLELSQGNAFFAEELVAAGIGERTSRLPPKLRDVVMARIETLSEDAQDTLRIIAAAGRRIEHHLVAAVSDLPDRKLLRALREATTHQVLLADAEGTYGFRHTIARDAVYADLLPGERFRLHAGLGRALAEDPTLARDQSPTVAVEIAHHWYVARETPKALAASVEAGRRAAGVYAFAEAHVQFDRALELWDELGEDHRPDAFDYGELLEQAADAAHWAGRLDRALLLARRALALVDPARDPGRAGVLQQRLGRYLWELGDGKASLAAYEEAGRLLADEPPSVERARVLAAQGAVLMVGGYYRESRARCEEAISMARTVGARAEEGHALNTLGIDLAMTGEPDAGIAALHQARAIARDARSFGDIGRVYSSLSFVLEATGRLDEAMEAARQGLEIMRQYRLERTSSGTVLLSNAASVLFRLGRWPEAEALIDDALAHDPPVGLQLLLFLVLGELELGQGRLEQAREHLGAARQMAEQTSEPQIFGPLYACLAELAIWQRDLDTAQTLVDRGLGLVGRGGDDYLGIRLCSLGVRVEAERAERALVRRAVDEVERSKAGAAKLLATALELAGGLAQRGVVLPEADAHLATCEAELSRLGEGSEPARWAAATRRWQQLGEPFPAAYTRWREAEALLSRKAAKEAGEALREAHRSAARLHAEPLRREVEALARRGRIDLRHPAATADGDSQPRPGADLGLTTREVEVLAHLLEGRTNRQIARALFITEKTASVHVSNILGKLGVANRGEAAAVAHRLGLLDPPEGTH